MHKMNVSYSVKNNLCMGCGVCEDICPSSSISVTLKNGQYKPIIDDVTCLNKKGCNKCFKICPGKGIRLSEFSETLFPSEQSDYYLGKYNSIYCGYSNEYEIRFHSASGGLLTQILIYLLENEIISGAVVTTYDASSSSLFKPIIAKTKEEIIAARSSKYTQVSFSTIIKSLKEMDGKFVVVGLPCHIQAFREVESIDKLLKNKVFAYFGLYCSSGRTTNMTEYIFKDYGIHKEKLEYFAYRDEGCLGSLVAKESGSYDPIKKYTFQSYYQPLRAIFEPKHCLTCIDYFAELADVSFGDLHIKPYSDDKIGINSIIVRNAIFLEIINNMKADNIISIKKLDKGTLLKAQQSVNLKKHRSAVFMKINKLFFLKNPIYDCSIIPRNILKGIIAYIHTHIQIFIGQHKGLWGIIKFIRKREKID